MLCYAVAEAWLDGAHFSAIAPGSRYLPHAEGAAGGAAARGEAAGARWRCSGSEGSGRAQQRQRVVVPVARAHLVAEAKGGEVVVEGGAAAAQHRLPGARGTCDDRRARAGGGSVPHAAVGPRS